VRACRTIAAVVAAATLGGQACGPGADDRVVNGVHQVTAAELWEWVRGAADAVQSVDVRVLPSFQAGHLPGALSVPGAAVMDPETGELVDEGRALTEAVPDRARRVLFYCSGADCNVSQAVAEQAVALGYADVWRLEGGIPAWTGAGYPLAVTVADFCAVPFYPLSGGDELVDVRSAAEFAAGAIPGAIGVPLDTFVDAEGNPVDDGRAFTGAVRAGDGSDFVFASSGGDALRAGVFAAEQGYRMLRLLEGTWADWRATACGESAP
jgi:rhodanese-related sulfurtransferase